MSKSKNLHILALLCNLAIIGFAVAGVILTVFENNGDIIKSLKYFTFLTGIVSGIVSCIAVIFHIKSISNKKDCCPFIIYVLRYIAATMGLLTFIIVMAVLVPTSSHPETLLNGGDLFLHILLPIVSVICFIFFEIEPKFRFRNSFIPFAVVGVYGIGIIITMVVIYFVSGPAAAQSFAPYPFFKILPGMEKFSVMNIVICIGVLLGSYVISLLVWFFNRMVSSIVIGREVVSKNTSNQNNRVIKRLTQEERSSLPNEISDKYDGNRVYHVSIYNHKIKNWKVKLATGERAIRIFKTQQEAIDYATLLARNYGGSVRVHSRLGRIRKD